MIDRVLHEEAQAMSRELRLADETRDALMRHPWPGSIRQLRHAMLRLRDQRRAAADAPVVPARSLQRRAVDADAGGGPTGAAAAGCTDGKPRRLLSSPRIWRCGAHARKPCAATSGG